MKALAKPDSSFASNRLTRSNAPNGHLLSTFRGSGSKDAKARAAKSQPSKTKPESEIDTDAEPVSSGEEEADDIRPSIETKEVDTDAEPLSSDENDSNSAKADIAQPSILNKDYIDTDAEPISSGEEQDSDSDSLPYRKDVNYNAKTLEQKLADKNNGSQSSSRVPNSGFRKGSSARTHSHMMGSDEDEPLFSGSSQPTKRRKEATYSSRASGPYFNRPPYPPRPHVKSQESSPAVEPSPAVEAPKEPDERFIVPKDISSSIFKEARGGEEANSSFSHGPFSLEDFEALGDDDSPLTSPPASSGEDTSQFEEKEDHQSPPLPKALCPLCHKEVDPVLLEIFKSQSKQRIREQVRFCESHNIRSATEQWKERGYPSIDWEKFEDRVQSYFPKLEKLLVPGAFSYYRNILDESVKSGQAKNFRLRAEDGKGLEMMTCGYYGALGATKMLEVVIRRFSVLVRRLALTDTMIKAVGVAGYTQSVIVPELAVLMVKDDMKVNDEDARQILRESMEIGGLLHPDHNVVPVPEEEKERSKYEEEDRDEMEEEVEDEGEL